MHVARAVLLASLVAACDGRHSATQGIEEPQRMIEAILGRIPVGTPLADVEQFMNSEGFKCTEMTHGAFFDGRDLDYLYCDRSEGNIVQRRWQVAIVHPDGKLSEVSASTGLVGP